MLKLRHNTLIALSGSIWLGIGASLLTLGLRLILNSFDATNFTPLLSFLSPYFGGVDYAAVALIALALGIGHFKGKYVLGKTVKRTVKKIHSLPNPSSLGRVYGFPYYILIATMILLGMSMRYFGLASDIRGVIDVAVGAALIQGAMRYFRCIGSQAICGN